MYVALWAYTVQYWKLALFFHREHDPYFCLTKSHFNIDLS